MDHMLEKNENGPSITPLGTCNCGGCKGTCQGGCYTQCQGCQNGCTGCAGGFLLW